MAVPCGFVEGPCHPHARPAPAALGAGGRGGKNGKRRTSVAWSDHGRPTRRTMARAVPVAPVGAVLQWEWCSSGSDALVGAMLRWERCSSGSGGRSDDSVVERSTRARDRKAAVRGSRHCGRGDAGRVDLSMPLTHVPPVLPCLTAQVGFCDNDVDPRAEATNGVLDVSVHRRDRNEHSPPLLAGKGL